MKKLSIVIVNWNTREYLRKCLESVFRYAGNLDYQLIVIDNHSQDSSQELLSSLRLLNDKIEVVLNKKNLGFAKAVNSGLRRAKGEYILLLNPDTQIKETTLEKSIKFMDDHSHCGVMGGKILNPDGSIQPSIRKFPTFLSQLFILLKLHHFTKNQSLKEYFSYNFDYSRTQEVDQVMGAFFLIRKSILEIIGYFDERFYLWFEEVDFCRRAKNANWRIFYYPEAEIVHTGGASFSQKISIRNQWQFNKSLLYYFKKHSGHLKHFLLAVFALLSLILALLTSILPIFKKNKKHY
jgi:GT2 family glycosyltransferase